MNFCQNKILLQKECRGRVDMGIQLFSIKPDIKEICKTVNDIALLTRHFSVLENSYLS